MFWSVAPVFHYLGCQWDVTNVAKSKKSVRKQGSVEELPLKDGDGWKQREIWKSMMKLLIFSGAEKSQLSLVNLILHNVGKDISNILYSQKMLRMFIVCHQVCRWFLKLTLLQYRFCPQGAHLAPLKMLLCRNNMRCCLSRSALWWRRWIGHVTRSFQSCMFVIWYRFTPTCIHLHIHQV